MLEQASVMGMMKAMVPITRFNKGEASRIFDEVEASGTKIVMKNNKPACILMSPERYEALMETVSDYLLLEEAEKRAESAEESQLISHEEMMREFDVSRGDLDSVEVEIEP